MSKLEALRERIRMLEGHHLEASGDYRVSPFACTELNAPLPRGGLQLGALHEFYASGIEGELAPAVTAFAASVAAEILRRQNGFLLWAASLPDCYPPGLARLGLDPSRIVWVDCAKDTEVLSVMEEALHSRAVLAVLGEASALSLKTARRLDAAARQSGATALLLRRHRSRPSKAAASPSGAAATRWRVSAVPGGHYPGTGKAALPRHPGNAEGVIRDLKRCELGVFYDPGYQQAGSGMTPAQEPGLGPPRFRLDLEYCRNGRTAAWIVEVSDGAKSDNAQAGHVRVAAELRDDACPLEKAPARQAQRAARSS